MINQAVAAVPIEVRNVAHHDDRCATGLGRFEDGPHHNIFDTIERRHGIATLASLGKNVLERG